MVKIELTKHELSLVLTAVELKISRLKKIVPHWFTYPWDNGSHLERIYKILLKAHDNA